MLEKALQNGPLWFQIFKGLQMLKLCSVVQYVLFTLRVQSNNLLVRLMNNCHFQGRRHVAIPGERMIVL